MKFTINSADLLSALTMLNRAQTSKNALPILDYFRVELLADSLRLTASDSEQTLDTTLPVIDPSDINQCVCVPAAQFLSALKELPSQPITFMGDDKTFGCRIDFANGHFNFMSANAADFPLPVTTLDNSRTLTIPANIFAQGLANTKNSISEDDLRPQMNGVYVDVFADGTLVFVASDGRSLSKNTFHIALEQEIQPFSFILPAKTTQILSNLLAKQTEPVTMSVNATNLIITINGYTLYSRLIEGRYPNYNSVIPKDNPFNAQVERDAIISAVRRVLVFASAATALIKFSFADDVLTVSAQDLDFSTSAEEQVPCEYNQQPIAIGFSGTMLIDLLKQLPPTTLNFVLAAPSRPGIITPANQPDDEETLLLLVPMMLKVE